MPELSHALARRPDRWPLAVGLPPHPSPQNAQPGRTPHVFPAPRERQKLFAIAAGLADAHRGTDLSQLLVRRCRDSTRPDSEVGSMLAPAASLDVARQVCMGRKSRNLPDLRQLEKPRLISSLLKSCLPELAGQKRIRPLVPGAQSTVATSLRPRPARMYPARTVWSLCRVVSAICSVRWPSRAAWVAYPERSEWPANSFGSSPAAVARRLMMRATACGANESTDGACTA